MKKALLLVALSAPLALAGCAPKPVAVYQAPPPPVEFDQVAQSGFHDGFEAARNDINHGRRPSVEQHPRFRNPPVPGPAWEDYRHGFREGYRRAMSQVPPQER
jgi:hypothetical protein